MKKRIIWSNIDVDFDEWKKDLIEYQKENKYDDAENVLDSEVHSFISESLENALEDERHNLNIKTEGRILVIADIGRWNGRVPGYKILGRNVSDILWDNDADHIEWFSDGYNIKAVAHHHDGTNYYTYKEIREDRNIQCFLDAIYNGKEITPNMIKYYTKSLNHYAKEVYGW